MGRKEEVKREGEGLRVQWENQGGPTNFSFFSSLCVALRMMNCDVIGTLFIHFAKDSYCE
jgi:hypothetical protein